MPRFWVRCLPMCQAYLNADGRDDALTAPDWNEKEGQFVTDIRVTRDEYRGIAALCKALDLDTTRP